MLVPWKYLNCLFYCQWPFNRKQDWFSPCFMECRIFYVNLWAWLKRRHVYEASWLSGRNWFRWRRVYHRCLWGGHATEIIFFQKFQDFEQKLIILLMFSPFLPALPVTTLANWLYSLLSFKYKIIFIEYQPQNNTIGKASSIPGPRLVKYFIFNMSTKWARHFLYK